MHAAMWEMVQESLRMQTPTELVNALEEHRRIFLTNAVAARTEYDPKTKKNRRNELPQPGNDLEKYADKLAATFGYQEQGVPVLRWVEREGNRPDCIPPFPTDWPIEPPGWKASYPFWILSQSAAEAYRDFGTGGRNSRRTN